MDYVSRCSYMLRQGNFVGDACLYYGDQAPNLVPPKRIDPNITPIFNDDQCLHCGKPKPVNASLIYDLQFGFRHNQKEGGTIDISDNWNIKFNPEMGGPESYQLEELTNWPDIDDDGIVWTPPYKARITPYLEAGTNNITVQVINTWNNRIVGDLKNPDQKPFTSTNAKGKFSKNSSLLKSGLTGKAKILLVNKYK